MNSKKVSWCLCGLINFLCYFLFLCHKATYFLCNEDNIKVAHKGDIGFYIKQNDKLSVSTLDILACASNFINSCDPVNFGIDTAQKMKFSIKDFFSKCDQIRSFLGIWSHILKKFLLGNFIFLCSAKVSFLWHLFTQVTLKHI